DQEVLVELRVERRDAVGDFEDGDDVLEEPADVGVMVADAGWAAAEVAQERLVPEEALSERPQGGGAGPSQGGLQLLLEVADVLVGVRQEISKIDLLALDAFDVVEDHLQGALEELHLAAYEDEVAVVEAAEEVLAGVPEPAADAAGAIA